MTGRRFFTTWPVAAAALGGLLLLVYTSVATTSRAAEDIYAQLDRLNAHHQLVENRLRRLRSDVYLSSIFIRDFLLDTDNEHAAEYRQRLSDLRRSHGETVAELRGLLPAGAAPRLNDLDTRLDDYWQAFDPLFKWSLYEKIVRSAHFLRHTVLPRRNAVLTITNEIEQLNDANVATQRAEVNGRLADFRDDLHRRLGRALLLGGVIALIAVLRLRALERRADRQRLAAERAEGEMRLLSQQLVAAQEEERKKLTRELHDHVGQMLTALRMELGRAARAAGGTALQLGAIAEAKRLLDTILGSVRDLAMGLRPSMLDDFGLQPALEWHVRDFRRRFGVPADLLLTGDVDSLPDHYRTCVYRIVQEALTNCARHAHAKRADIALRYEHDTLELRVVDDGVGIDPAAGRGFGLLGIEERVRELHGSFRIGRGARGGTELHVTLPVVASIPAEVALARAAG